MSEHHFRLFQVIFQTVAAIGAVTVFFTGLHRWNAEQNSLLETRIHAEQTARDREFDRELWMRKVETLAEIAETASRLAASADDQQRDRFDAAAYDIERAYWGSVTFVDNPKLDQILDDVRNEIRNLRNELGPYPPGSKGQYTKLKELALAVVGTCRKLIHESGEEFAGIPQ